MIWYVYIICYILVAYVFLSFFFVHRMCILFIFVQVKNLGRFLIFCRTPQFSRIHRFAYEGQRIGGVEPWHALIFLTVTLQIHWLSYTLIHIKENYPVFTFYWIMPYINFWTRSCFFLARCISFARPLRLLEMIWSIVRC